MNKTLYIVIEISFLIFPKNVYKKNDLSQTKARKTYTLGIIPHYVDKNSIPSKLRNNHDILIIDIQGGINKVVVQICSWNKILQVHSMELSPPMLMEYRQLGSNSQIKCLVKDLNFLIIFIQLDGQMNIN